RACSWPSWVCKAGKSGAGSTCRRSRYETGGRALAYPPHHSASLRGGRGAPSLRAKRKEAVVATISLPTADRKFAPYTTGEPIAFPSKADTANFNRVAYGAAHVVADPLADSDPWLDTAIDWDRTVAFRNYLWDLGLGVAAAMDTAQRGGGLDWPAAKQLIGHSLEAAK